MKQVILKLSEPLSPIITDLLSELSDNGLLKDGVIQYDEKDKTLLHDLFEKYYLIMSAGNKLGEE